MAPDANPSEEKRPKRRSKWIWIVLAALTFVIGLAGVVGWSYLQSQRGEERLRKAVLDAASDAIAGRLELKSVELSGASVVLRHLKLYTPEGELVAEIERAELHLSLAKLLSRDVVISKSDISGVGLYLNSDERGLNLNRAVAARKPSADSSEGGPFHVQIQNFKLSSGTVTWEKQYSLGDISILGDLDVRGAPLQLNGLVEVQGLLAGEPALPLQIKLQAVSPQLGLSLTLGEAKVDGEFSFKDEQLAISEAVIPPSIVQRFAPSSEASFKQPIKLNGVLGSAGGQLQAAAGSTQLTTQVEKSGESIRFQLQGEEIDFSEWVKGAPKSQVSLNLKGQIDNTDIKALTGHVDGEAHWEGLADVDLKASAKNGAFQVPKLALDAPGASLVLSGTGTSQSLDLKGKFEAGDLKRFGNALKRKLGVEMPNLAGAGQLSASLSGPLQALRLALQGDMKHLTLDSAEMNAVTLAVAFPNVSRPLEASIEAQVKQLQISGRSFRDVNAKLATAGRRLNLQFSTRGLADISLEAGGILGENGNSARVETLTLQYPEQRWVLESPMDLSFESGVRVGPLALVGNGQKLSLALKTSKNRLDASMDAQSLDLGTLPKALVSQEAGLKGKVDAHVVLNGPTKAPNGQVEVWLRSGAVHPLTRLQAHLKADLAAGRAKGQLDADSSAGKVSAQFDVPQRLEDDKKVSFDATLQKVDLGALKPQEPVAQGTLDLSVGIHGTLGQPTVDAKVTSQDLRIFTSGPQGPTVPLKDFVGEIRSMDDGAAIQVALSGKAFAAGFDASAQIESVPILLRAVRRPEGVFAKQVARTLPVRLKLQIQKLSLDALREAGFATQFVGTLDGSLQARGTMERPIGEAKVKVSKLQTPSLKPVDSEATVSFAENGLRVSVIVEQPQQRLLHLTAESESSLVAWLEPSTLSSHPLKVRGDVGPLAFDDVMEPTEGGTRKVKGKLAAQIEVVGTLAAPVVTAKSTVQGLNFGKATLGQAELNYAYRAQRSALSAELKTGSAGTLKLDGTLDLDFGWASLQKGLNWRSGKLEAATRARQFELNFLSGAVETIPKVGGVLNATANWSGTLGVPQLNGNVALTQGRALIQGLGEYRDVELVAVGTQQEVRVDKLSLRASSGQVAFKGAAKKDQKSWILHASGSAQSFPIVTDDQLKATATLEDIVVEGRISENLIDIRPLKLSRAVVELPAVKGKDLQDLERPESIVLVRNGVPVNLKAKQKLEAAKGTRKPEVTAETKPPARTVTVVVEAPKNLWVKSSDVNVELGLSDGFRVEYADAVSLWGEVRVKGGNRGSFEVLGRKFELDPASVVTFRGAASRPYVNIIATHNNDREGVVVTATVVGQLPQVTPRLTSNPPMSESDIFALIATGRRTLKQGGSATMTNDQVVSVLGSLGASMLKNTLGKKLPLDVLSIETGSEGLKGSRVEGGKYLTDEVYLGLEARYGADPRKGENDFAARVEWEFVPHWSVEAYGGNTAYGAELVTGGEF